MAGLKGIASRSARFFESSSGARRSTVARH
jgi:hypothetical protein